MATSSFHASPRKVTKSFGDNNKGQPHRQDGETLLDKYGNLGDYSSKTIYLAPIQAGQGKLELNHNTLPSRGPLPAQPMIEWNENAIICGNLILKQGSLEGIEKFYPELLPHASMMFDRLTWHKNHFGNDTWIDPIIMVGRSCVLGPAFTADWVDDAKLSRFRMMNMVFNQEEGLEPKIIKNNYSDSYIGYHFIYWIEDDPLKYMDMFGKPPDTEDDVFLQVQNLASDFSEKYLPDEEYNKPPPDNFLYRPVATGGFDGVKTRPEWEIELDFLDDDLEEELLIAARSVAPKRPTETRDIGIQKPSSLRFHRRIMWYLKLIVSRIPGCVYGRDLDYIRNVVSRLGRKNEYFYMRDYTTSGMTIPHKVIRAVFTGVFSRTPEFGEKAARFFEQQQFYIRESSGLPYDLMRPETGGPLGMFVEGYTLLQYIIHELNLGELPNGQNKGFMFSATNDDMVVGHKDLEILQAYNAADIRINSELGMSYKDTKSGISTNSFVFCEEYWLRDHIDPKDALLSVTMIGAKYCATVFQAKEYCHSILMSAGEVTPNLLHALREIQTSMGYEFHPDEFNWPYLFGGWLPQLKSGVDCSIQWYNGDLRAKAGYWANRTKIAKPTALGDKPLLTIGRKKGIKLVAQPSDIPDWVDLVPYLGTKRTLKRHFRLAHSHPKDILKEYIKLGEKRLAKYNRMISGESEIPDPMESWLERHPNSYILDSMPYIKTEPGFTRISRPEFAISDTSEKQRLRQLQYKGYITINDSGYVSNAEIIMAQHGILHQCNLSYLPVGESPCSSWVLANSPRNYLDFYERTNRVITSVSTEDTPFIYSQLWAYMPWADLRTVIRLYTMAKEKAKGPLETNHLIWWADIHRQMSKQESQVFDVNEDPPDKILSEEALNHTRNLFYDILRDYKDREELIATIMKNAVPLDGSLFDMYRDTTTVNVDYELTELRGANPDSGLLLPDNEENSDDEVFDPWAELGVT